MPELITELSRRGHVARVRTLVKVGVTPETIARAVALGTAFHPRPRWIASPCADAEQLTAVAIGAPIGCVSALRRLGIWAGDDDVLHLHAPPTSGHVDPERTGLDVSTDRVWHPRAPARRRSGAVRSALPGTPHVHWAPDPAPSRALDWVVSPQAALARAVRCLPEEHARASVDSVLHEGVLSRDEVDEVLSDVATSRTVVDGFTGTLESGVESLFVRRLAAAGFSITPQVQFAEFGRFDGLIDGLVLFEIDGRGYHSGPDEFYRDRDRTLIGHMFGVPVLRPSARHVLEDWPTVFEAVSRAVADAAIVRAARNLPLA